MNKMFTKEMVKRATTKKLMSIPEKINRLVTRFPNGATRNDICIKVQTNTHLMNCMNIREYAKKSNITQVEAVYIKVGQYLSNLKTNGKITSNSVRDGSREVLYFSVDTPSPVVNKNLAPQNNKQLKQPKQPKDYTLGLRDKKTPNPTQNPTPNRTLYSISQSMIEGLATKLMERNAINPAVTIIEQPAIVSLVNELRDRWCTTTQISAMLNDHYSDMSEYSNFTPELVRTVLK